MTKSKNYLNKKDLLEEIYKSRDKDELTKECLNMLMMLAQKTIRKLYYKCEDDKQNALSEAYYDLVKNWRKFDPDFARFHGYSDLVKGDEIRVCPDKNSQRTASAIVVENYPIEKLITKVENQLRQENHKIFDIIYLPVSKQLKVIRKPTNIELKDSDKNIEYFIDASDYNKIKLDYIVKKNKRHIDIFDKSQIIIKEPNPFSFFTSACVNGYAKGWKKLYPKKSKGKLISIDSGFNTDGDGMHSL